jgi:hypothetical protein
MKTRIHVNQHIIKSNQTTGHRTPPLTVKNYKTNIKAREVLIAGPCRVVYMPDNPLSCGARVWIETDGKVLVDGEIPETSLQEILNTAWKSIEGVRPRDVNLSVRTREKIREYENRVSRSMSMFEFTMLSRADLEQAIGSLAADEIQKILSEEFGWGTSDISDDACPIAVSVEKPKTLKKKVTKNAGKTKNKVKGKAAKKAKTKPRAARLSRRG